MNIMMGNIFKNSWKMLRFLFKSGDTIEAELSFSYYYHSNLKNRNIHLICNVLIYMLYSNLVYLALGAGYCKVFMLLISGVFSLMNFYVGVSYYLLIVFGYYFVYYKFTSYWLILSFMLIGYLMQLVSHSLFQNSGISPGVNMFEIFISTPVTVMLLTLHENFGIEEDLVGKVIALAPKWKE